MNAKNKIRNLTINSFESGIVFLIGIYLSCIKQDSFIEICIGILTIILSLFITYKSYKKVLSELNI